MPSSSALLIRHMKEDSLCLLSISLVCMKVTFWLFVAFQLTFYSMSCNVMLYQQDSLSTTPMLIYYIYTDIYIQWCLYYSLSLSLICIIIYSKLSFRSPFYQASNNRRRTNTVQPQSLQKWQSLLVHIRDPRWTERLVTSPNTQQHSIIHPGE